MPAHFESEPLVANRIDMLEAEGHEIVQVVPGRTTSDDWLIVSKRVGHFVASAPEFEERSFGGSL